MSTPSRSWSPALRLAVFTAATTALGLLAVVLRAATDASAVASQSALLLYSIPANTGLSFFSHEVALLDYGANQHLVLSTLSATVGTAIAGLLDWRFFVPLLDSGRLAEYRDKRSVQALLSRFQRAPFAVIFITAASPIPFFPFKMMAFSVGYPLRRYLAALLLARAPRYFLIALLGAVLEPPAWLLLAALATLLAVAAVKEAAEHGLPAVRRLYVRRQQA